MTIVWLTSSEEHLFYARVRGSPTDICRPIEVKTFSRCNYFVTFIDNASKKVWAYALNSKGDVLDIFKGFHVAVERETSKLLKCLISNNGGEYSSISFDDYCSKHNIKHEKTVLYSPQLNRVAERMNMTLTERIWSLLSSAKLPKGF